MPNLCGKTRPKTNPYEVWEGNGWRYLVLKKYQTPEREAENPYARWLCYVESPFTGSIGDMGDTYVQDVVKYARLVERDGQPV